ncbi:MAG TPA: hypothetical protein VNT30_02695 [Stellaceae bacterium]|nr:hypothetical protein [Stellaceae bacterium]
MPFKPNYNQQRAERDRAKQAKMQEKLRQQQEETALRKAGKTTTDTTAEDEQTP